MMIGGTTGGITDGGLKMEETVSVRFRVMVILNVLPFLFCIVNGISDLGASKTALVLQLLLIWENYYFTHSIKKMLVLDAVSFLTVAAGNMWSASQYMMRMDDGGLQSVYERILGERVSFVVWIFSSLLFILGMLAWAFYVRRRRRETIVTAGIFGVGAVLFVWFLSLFHSPYAEESRCYIEYEGCGKEIACTDEREGEIVWDMDEDEYEEMDTDAKVVIRDRMGNELTQVTDKELTFTPDLIALGEEYYYVFGEGYDEESSVLVQLDYESRIVGKIECGDLDSLVCRDGILFLGENWERDEEVGDCQGFYADAYIKESEFGEGGVQKCVADAEGKCQIGAVTLYQHSDGSFSTNPEIERYPESADYEYYWADGLDEVGRNQWNESVSRFLSEQGLRSGDYVSVNEYQSGTEIYGVINVETSSFFGISNEKRAYAYQMDVSTAQFQLLGKWRGATLIYSGGEYVIYRRNDTIYGEDRQTGQKEELYELSETQMTCHVAGEYVRVEDGEDTVSLHILP